MDAAGDLVNQWLALCQMEAEKLDGYAALIRELELRAEARKAEAQRILERAKADESKAAFLKERLKEHLFRHGRKSIETARFRITHAAHGGRLPVLLSVDPEHLPAPYRVEQVRYKADLEALRAALDAHGEITDGEGQVLVRYGERGSSIRIR